MKIAVTGCNGDVGTRVVLAALARGHTVVGIDSTPTVPDALLPHLDATAANTEDGPSSSSSAGGVTGSSPGSVGGGRFVFHAADLRDYDRARALLEGCEAVVQLAAMRTPGDYVVETHNTNVVISWNILRACAELEINRVAQASSVNVIPLVWTERKDFQYFPLDEEHPCRPDEPYGLSKVICELQAETIVRRYPHMRVASLRLSWSLPSRQHAMRDDPQRRMTDLWGYVQEDAAADAFLLAVAEDKGREQWSGHEAFFITAPDTADELPSMELRERYWKEVPIKEGKDLSEHKGFFDCSKAERLLGWVHRNPEE